MINRQLLKRQIIANRSSQQKGSGDAYWESVVDVVERHVVKQGRIQNVHPEVVLPKLPKYNRVTRFCIWLFN